MLTTKSKDLINIGNYDPTKPNIICWFSCGVTSAVSIKLAIDKYKSTHNILIYYFVIDSAHDDNERFLNHCEQWYQIPIIKIRSHKYKDQFDVIEKIKFINSPYGASCTLELKKKIRMKIEKQIEFDYQVFGYEFDNKQINRAIRFLEQYPNSKAIFPLIEARLDKQNALRILLNNKIDIPEMYKLGFQNNNCIGCVKGGKGYWNKIRDNFSIHFEKMKQMEEIVGRSCIKGTFLKDLKNGEGRHESVDLPDCGVVCDIEFGDITSQKTLDIFNKLKNISDFYDYKKND